MILIGLFLIVLAGAFIVQALGIGGENVFDVVWPLLVVLIGVGFVMESRRAKKMEEQMRLQIEKEVSDKVATEARESLEETKPAE